MTDIDIQYDDVTTARARNDQVSLRRWAKLHESLDAALINLGASQGPVLPRTVVHHLIQLHDWSYAWECSYDALLAQCAFEDEGAYLTVRCMALDDTETS